MIDILKRIENMRLERNWTEYELSKKADIPQSTIHAWYRKNQVPALSSLEKLCNAFGIPLSVLFSEDSYLIELSEQELNALRLFQCLNSNQKTRLLQFLSTLTQESQDELEKEIPAVESPSSEPDDSEMRYDHDDE